MKLILFFSFDVSLSVWSRSGLLSRELLLYEELITKGHEVTFITYGDSTEYMYLPKHSNIKLLPIFQYIPRPESYFARLFLSLLFVILFVSRINSIDLIKANQMNGALLPSLLSLLVRKPFYLRTGYEYYSFVSKQSRNPLLLLFVYLTSFIAYHLASYASFSTEDDLHFAARLFKLSEHKTSVLPNWIDTNRFRPYSNNKPIRDILMIGRLDQQKNLQFVLSALKNPELKITIVGRGALEPLLKQISSHNQLDVDFIPFVDNKDLPSYYNSHKIYCMPSLYEGNPKTLLEAMACGSLVLAANSPGISTLISGKHPTGLLFDLTSLSFLSVLEQALNPSFDCERYKTNARNYVLSNASLDSYVANEITLYHHLALTA